MISDARIRRKKSITSIRMKLPPGNSIRSFFGRISMLEFICQTTIRFVWKWKLYKLKLF